MPNDLRLELRTRNNVLWHAIFDLHGSVNAFCREFGFQATEIGKLLNLTKRPMRANGTLIPTAQRLCDVTGIHGDELFPARLYSELFPKRMVAEVESERFVSLAAARRLALPAPDDDNSPEMTRDLIVQALKCLTPRQNSIIQELFGLDGDGPKSCDDIAAKHGVTRERIRQIQIKSLDKLKRVMKKRLGFDIVSIERSMERR